MTTPIRELPPGRRDADGGITFSTHYTPESYPVSAGCPVPSDRVIPVIFVPGIMGSNLMSTEKQTMGKVSWRAPNGKADALVDAVVWANRSPKERQTQLDPASTAVDGRGDIKLTRSNAACLTDPAARERGWGEVHLDSYSGILNLLTEQLNRVFLRRDANGDGTMPYPWWSPLIAAGKGVHKDVPKDFQVTEADLKHLARFHFPVYACGYNWLQSNADSATALAALIDEVIKEQRDLKLKCDKVILVTHSMGGLVARACAKLNKKEGAVLGVIHGVQPAVGAPAAYRRIAAGTETSSPRSSTAGHIEGEVFSTIAGRTPAETTPVMANSPGALELLPNHLYPPGWLRVTVARTGAPAQSHTITRLPRQNPYDEIYRTRNQLFSLINPALLGPTNADRKALPEPVDTLWDQYLNNLDKASGFHGKLGNYYHPNTYVYYGADKEQQSYGTICWHATSDAYNLPTAADLHNANITYSTSNGNRRSDVNYVSEVNYRPPPLPDHGMPLQTFRPVQEKSLLFTIGPQDAAGDGTVPEQSGAAPGKAGVKKSVKMTGFSHQGSYQNPLAQHFVLHAICKMVQGAK